MRCGAVQDMFVTDVKTEHAAATVICAWTKGVLCRKRYRAMQASIRNWRRRCAQHARTAAHGCSLRTNADAPVGFSAYAEPLRVLCWRPMTLGFHAGTRRTSS